jgi:hypothetical protein
MRGRGEGFEWVTGCFSRVRASLTAEPGRRRRKRFALPGLEGGAVGFEGARYVRLGVLAVMCPD